MGDLKAMIQARRAEIDARRAEIDAIVGPLENERLRLADELADLRVAERVSALLNGEQPPKPPPPRRRPRRGETRPIGIPSTNAMLQTVLGEAVAATGVGLTPAEIVVEIRRRWWPDVKYNQVVPPLYRTVQRGGRFEREGDRFRPKLKAP